VGSSSFIRRAVEDDKTLRLATILRTTQNKTYRQNLGEKELAEGFPARVEDLFGFEGVIIGTVEAGYFSTTQQGIVEAVLWIAGVEVCCSSAAERRLATAAGSNRRLRKYCL